MRSLTSSPSLPSFLRFLVIGVLLLLAHTAGQAQVIDDIKNAAKQTATQKTEDKTNNTTNSAFNKADSAGDKTVDKLKGLFKKKKKTDPAPAPSATASNGNSAATASTTNNPAQTAPGQGNGAPAGPAGLSVYSNYDFVPGEQVLFEDHFIGDMDGEFPSHWKLVKGQALLNKINGDPAFFLTEGNYVRVSPRMRTDDNYLPDNFTIDFDLYFTSGSNAPLLLFSIADGSSRNIQFGKEVGTGYFPNDLSGTYPGDQDHFEGNWHHAAMIKKGNQIKCYLDQYRVLVIPDCGSCKVTSLDIGGIGSQQEPIVFKNFRLAAGGNMNMIGQKFTDARLVTHGINFDVDQATIRPESMGTLNMVVNILKDNPDLKFEIDGHTDNTGNAAHNLDLSQHRADAVKTQLVNMGVDPSRLSTKGFGDTLPIGDNNTLEGKANNRRVEFVKM
ncbi:MAG TPA: OmpA family protein [Puia sp.]|jgi:outer membrane protein OmpA-like peptidoglycan-associated protein